MFTLTDCFYEINIVSIAARLLLAVILSGIIGLERGAIYLYAWERPLP